MPLEQIITIIIVALIVVFAWGIFKKLLKLMFYAGLIISLLLAANLYFIYKDFADLRENFAVSERIVILKENDKVLTGLVLNEDTNPMTTSQLNDFSTDLKTNNYDKILGDSYKLMIFDIGIISSLDTIELEDKTITNNEAINVLRNSQSNEEKAELFNVILADEILSSKNPLFFFSEFKKGNIIIYPETALFKTVKIIPLPFIKDAGKKIFETTRQKAKTFVVEE